MVVLSNTLSSAWTLAHCSDSCILPVLSSGLIDTPEAGLIDGKNSVHFSVPLTDEPLFSLPFKTVYTRVT